MPATQKPLSFSSSIVLAKFVTRITGTCSIAPVEAFATVCLSVTERRLGIITPSTPVASAVLKIDPKLCGSSKPSNISTVDKPSFSFCCFKN